MNKRILGYIVFLIIVLSGHALWSAAGDPILEPGSTGITTVGTIATGTWEGTAVDISDHTTLAVDTNELTLTDDSLGLANHATARSAIGLGTGDSPQFAGETLSGPLTFTGATTVNQIKFPDNLADALSLQEGANKYITIVTTDGDEDVLFSVPLDIQHTATAADDHTIEMDVNAAGYGDVKALDIDYITGAISDGEDEGVILINIDEIDATGGEVFAVEVLATDQLTGTTNVHGLKVGPLIAPVHQDSGTFANPTFASNDTPSTDVSIMRDGLIANTTAIFTANSDYIIIGAAAAFQDMELIFSTASSKGIKPTFWYSINGGSDNFTQFTPVDGTDGCRHTGVISWDASDLSNHVADGTTGTFNIKIIRTRGGTIQTTPILGYAKTAATTEYVWDKNGDLSIKGLTVAGDIVMGGSYQVTGLQAPAASGEAIRQTATITEAALESAIGDGHVAVTLNASATTGGLSLSTQEISHRAATNAQTGYATAAHITAIEANTTDSHVAGTDPNDHASGSDDQVSSDFAHDDLQSGTIADHDTGATGTELDTLTDNSMADALHRHSELSASDGTPDQALVVDAIGNVGIRTVPSSILHLVSANPVVIISASSTNSNPQFQLRADSVGGKIYAFYTSGSAGLNPGDFVIRDGGAGEDRFVIDTNGNIGVGTTLGPVANGTKVLFFGDNTADPSMNTNTAGLYAKDVSGTVEAFAIDEADNETQLTPHNFTLFQPDPNEPYPWSYYGRNKMLGKEINVDMAGAIRAIEELSGREFIHYADIEKVPKDIPAGKRKAWKARWIKENTAEHRVLKAEAIEQVEVDIITEEIESYDIKWRLVDGILKFYFVPEYEKATKLVWQLKEGVRLDEDNGRFYKNQIPTDAEAEIAAEAGFSYELPAWLAARIK